MRPSPQRHTLAVLRTLIGFTQKEMAAILECSTPTIQAVELGKLKLSLDLAQRVHFQTGVCTEWLLAGDVTQPPVSTQGKPYTKALFEERQAALLSPKKTGMDALLELWQTWHMFMKHTKILAILYSEAYKRGKVPLAFYKSITPQADLFEKLFGEDKTIEAKLAALANIGIDPVYLSELDEPLADFQADTLEELKRKLKQTKTPLPEPVRNYFLGVYEKPLLRPRKKKQSTGQRPT
jgi:DNA-binding XRE family transcriptional regulator